MKHFKAVSFFLMLAAMTVAAHALDEKTVVGDHFNPKVSAWAEGTVMAVNADNGTFMLHGAKNAYATAYAKMLQEIHSKTMKLDADARVKKEAAIRAEWATPLEKARLQAGDKDSDFTFHLPSKDARLSYFDESSYYNRKTFTRTEHVNPNGGNLTAEQHAAMVALKDLKVGDFLAVGYDNGVISNDAYIVIKGNKVSIDGRVKSTELARETEQLKR